MKFQIYSDIHLEFCKKIPIIKKTADNLILAGDIFNIKLNKSIYNEFFESINKTYKHTLYVPGNHEFHTSYETSEDYYELDNKYRTYFKSFDNIYYLNNNSIEIDNKLFIGSTLWSHPTLSAVSKFTDFHKIYMYKMYILDKIKLSDFHQLNNNSIDYITKTLDQNKTKDIVMITHFPPIKKDTYDKKYDNKCNYFTNNLEKLIEDNIEIKYWIYGHTHYINKQKLFNTEIITNALGYPNELYKDNTDYNDTILDV